MLVEAWVARCSPNSDLGRAQKSLVSKRLKSFFKSMSYNKIQSTRKKFNLVTYWSHALYRENRLQAICKQKAVSMALQNKNRLSTFFRFYC